MIEMTARKNEDSDKDGRDETQIRFSKELSEKETTKIEFFHKSSDDCCCNEMLDT